MATVARITVIGSGYVGLTTGACFASLGHLVTCVDRDTTVINALRRGQLTLGEPEIHRIVNEGVAAGRLGFDSTVDDAARGAEFVFLCLPTPSRPDGSADIRPIEAAVIQLRDFMSPGTVAVVKSTVPVGTGDRVRALLGRADIAVVSNPEFLREGHAVHDFLNPTRIVIGSYDAAAAKKVAALHDALGAQVIITDPTTAELSKYAANCFLATKLSYVNTVAELCDAVGADIVDLTHIVGADLRIGPGFLRPGPGWGGPCLPKDARALMHQSLAAGVEFPILAAAITSNTHHQARVVEILRAKLGGVLAGAHIGVLGLTFKAGTSDLRDSPAVTIAQALAGHGAIVTAHDPTVDQPIAGVAITPEYRDVAVDADVLVLLTDWPEYQGIDWKTVRQLMAGDIVLDIRNALDSTCLTDAGLRWIGFGKPPDTPFQS